MYTKTSVAPVQKIPIYITKDAMLSFFENNYGGKFGKGTFKAMATPLMFTQEGTFGSFLYKKQLLRIYS